MRGTLTKEINEIAFKIIGRKINQLELRLMPYIQYVMINEQKIDPRKINSEERKVLKKWKDEGFIEGGATGLAITKEFWDFMNEILFQGYVSQQGEKDEN